MVRKVQKSLEKALDRINIPHWLIWVMFLTFLVRIPSFFEPFWYGDEMIYLSMGEGLRTGRVFYRDIYDNKPPLLYLVASIAGNVFWFKVILTAWLILTIFFFWKLIEKLFPKMERLAKISVIFFAFLTSIPLLEGNITNAEIFMIGPTILGFFLVFGQKMANKTIFWAGISFSIATLFKVPASLDMASVLLIWFFMLIIGKKDLFSFLQNVTVFMAGFLLPIFLTILYYWHAGALQNYLSAAFLNNLGYLSSWRPTNSGQTFFERNQPLLIRAFVLFTSSSILSILYKNKKISSGFWILGNWFLFSLFSALLSERPYPHYLIQILPSFSILLGVIFAGKAKEMFYPFFLFAILGISLIYYKFGYYAVFSYYENFLFWVTGNRSRSEYLSNFDRRVPRTYEVADYISRHTNTKDPIFVWGDDTAIYALSHRLPPGRFLAAYHILDFKGQDETLSSLKNKSPRYIILISGEKDFPQLQQLITKSYFLVKIVEDAKIYRLAQSAN